MSTQRRRSTGQFPSPHLLVASPHVQGTPYDRQVVLLLKHASRGSVGVALNERFQESVRQIRGRTADPLLQRRGGSAEQIAVPVGVVHWSPGQLDAEMKQGIWLTSPAKIDELFSHHDDLWVDLVRHIGRSILADALNIEHMPADPSLN